MNRPDGAAVEKSQPYDYVIALGKNYDSGQTPKRWSFTTPEGTEEGFLSPASELVARAAAELLLSGRTHKVLFSTGYTSGTKFLSEAETMRLFVRDQYPTVPWEAMEVETKSKNTEENGEETFKMIGMVARNAILLSTSYHFPRASEAFERAGWKELPFLTCEDVLGGVDDSHHLKQQYEELLEIHRTSGYFRIETKKEKYLVRVMRNKIVRALFNTVTLLLRR